MRNQIVDVKILGSVRRHEIKTAMRVEQPGNEQAKKVARYVGNKQDEGEIFEVRTFAETLMTDGIR